MISGDRGDGRRRRHGAPWLTHLRREVVWGTAQRPDGRRAVLREAEIGDLDVAVVVEQDVLGLQISVDDVF